MASSYQLTKISDTHWRICEQGVNMDLLIGTERALLIDTGYGFGNLPAAIATVTDKPVTVVCTHGHPDHACGGWQFPEFWLHPADEEICRMYNTFDWRAQNIPNPKPDDFLEEAYRAGGAGQLRFCRAEQVFDLGGLALEVVELPGHTAGSIGLLDRANRELYVGDAMNGALFLFQKGVSQPLSVSRRTLAAAMARPADTLWLGHEPGAREKVSSIELYEACAKDVDFDRCFPCGEMLGEPDVRLWVIPTMRDRLEGQDDPVGSVYRTGLAFDPGFASIFIAKDLID